MQQSNSLSDQELQELLKLAKQAKEEEVEPVYNDVLAFINHFNIKHGKFALKTKLLYKLYDMWSKNPVSSKSFHFKITDHFHVQNGLIYINKNSLHLDNEVLRYYHTKVVRDKRKSPKYRKVLERFIKDFNLVEGNTWVEAYVLFYLYDKWNYERGYTKTLGPISFTALLKLYIPFINTKSGPVLFKLDPEPLYQRLTKEKIEEMRKSYNEKVQRRSKEKISSRRKKEENKQKKATNQRTREE